LETLHCLKKIIEQPKPQRKCIGNSPLSAHRFLWSALDWWLDRGCELAIH